MKIQAKSTINIPDRNYLSYFTAHVDEYQAFKRGEVVDFPEEVVAKLQNITIVNESTEDGESIIEIVEEEEVSEVSASVGEEDVVVEEEVVEEEEIDYRAELIDVKGIGPATADDIIDVYPVRSELIQALQEGTASEFPSQILDMLNGYYLGE